MPQAARYFWRYTPRFNSRHIRYALNAIIFHCPQSSPLLCQNNDITSGALIEAAIYRHYRRLQRFAPQPAAVTIELPAATVSSIRASPSATYCRYAMTKRFGLRDINDTRRRGRRQHYSRRLAAGGATSIVYFARLVDARYAA